MKSTDARPLVLVVQCLSLSLALRIPAEEGAPRPRAEKADAEPLPRVDRTACLEVEAFAGPWRTQTNYPGYSGWGFRVSNASGVAVSELRTTVIALAAGEYTVRARGLVSPHHDRSFSVQVGESRFPPTHGTAETTGFRWDLCGRVTLGAGPVDIVVRDAGAGYECPDAIFLSLDPDALPPEDTEAPSGPGGAWARRIASENLARLVELHDRDDAARRTLSPTSEAWTTRRARLESDVRRALGLDPEPPRSPLSPRKVGVLERGDYAVENLVFESRPGMPVPANLYLPAGEKAPPPPWPVVLCPVGHWGLSKAEPVVQSRAVGFAKLGLAALVYDALGQGERAVEGNEHSQAYLAALVGESNMTYMVWDSVRAIDYLETRPEVDSRKLGVTGCSGGGLNTLYLMAVEKRLDAAAPVGYVCTFSSFLKTGIVHCPCSHVPGMARLTDMGEVAALFAPRPLLVVGGRKDPMFTEAGMRAAFDEIRALYALSGAPSTPRIFFDDCGHDYSRPMREEAYGFFLQALAGKGSGDAVPEPMAGTSWQPEVPEALFSFPGGKIPPGTLTYRRSVLERISSHGGKSPSAVIAFFKDSLQDPDWRRWKVEPSKQLDGASTTTDEEGFSHRTYLARGSAGAGAASEKLVLALTDAGLASTTMASALAVARRCGTDVLAIEPPLWCEVGDPSHLAITNGLLLGRPLSHLWARAVMGHVSRECEGGRRVFLLAQGPASSAMALTSFLCADGKVEALAAAHPIGSWTDLTDPGVSRPAAIWPGAGTCGDVADLLRAAAPRRVLWSGSSLRASLPPCVDARERTLPLEEAAAWLLAPSTK